VRSSPLPPPALAAAQRGQVDRTALRAGLERGDLADLPSMTGDLLDAWADGLAVEVLEHAERSLLEQQERTRLAALGHPVLDLPRLADGIDLGVLYTLADILASQGVRGPDPRRSP
jgi:hypothetical protein